MNLFYKNSGVCVTKIVQKVNVMKIKYKNKTGFTLIEVLVVVLIIGILAAVAVPGYMRSVEKTRAMEAIQALSDISKAEHDYYLSKNRYTNDFSDLVIATIDKNTLQEATHSSYKTDFFVYNLDNTQNLATANRDKGPDSYTLYKFFDDPITYCQPEGNKYCLLLDLSAGAFTHSIGAWQSCEGGSYPCSKACTRKMTPGYTCYGTYNFDGSFTEKVCDYNNTCTTIQYNSKQVGLVKTFCYTYNESNTCAGGTEIRYDENGRPLSLRKCTAWDEIGNCTDGKGTVYAYDENGNKIKHITCNSWKSDGTCAVYGSGTIYSYDEKGRVKTEITCFSWNNDGSCAENASNVVIKNIDTADGRITIARNCASLNSEGICTSYKAGGTERTYDKNGNETRYATCLQYNSEGNCTSYKENTGSLRTYDENGNQTSYANCATWNSNGTGCATYQNYGTITYDENGNQIIKSSCYSVNTDGSCNQYTNYVYKYDENGNQTSYATCTNLSNNGTCNTYGTSGYVYTYDSNGNKTSSRPCTGWNNSNGNCENYGTQGTIYIYDSQGKQTSEIHCNNWDSSGNCSEYGSGYVYTYDINGKNTSFVTCGQFNNDKTCAYYTYAVEDVYDENGNVVGQFHCSDEGLNSDGTCNSYGLKTCPNEINSFAMGC